MPTPGCVLQYALYLCILLLLTQIIVLIYDSVFNINHSQEQFMAKWPMLLIYSDLPLNQPMIFKHRLIWKGSCRLKLCQHLLMATCSSVLAWQKFKTVFVLVAGILQHPDGTVLKQLQPPPRGPRELQFYSTVMHLQTIKLHHVQHISTHPGTTLNTW